MADTIDRLWDQLDRWAPPWAATSMVVIALLALVFLRRFIDHAARGRTRTPAIFLLAALGFRLGAWITETAAMPSGASTLGLLAVLCFVVGIVGIGSIGVFDLAFRRHPVPAVLRDLVQFVVVLVVFLGTLYHHGLDPVSLVATGGVLTAVVGFALQSTIANVFAGVALPLEHELAIGDWIEVNQHVGRIREIKWRSTTIVTKDGDTVIVPNNQLITSSVTNYSRPTGVHRLWIRLAFHYRHPPNEVRQVVLDAVQAAPGVLGDPAPDCFVLDFADSAVAYGLRIWIDDFVGSDPIAGEARARIWYAAHRAGLEMPFPIRTLIGAAPVVEDAIARRRTAVDRVDLFSMLDEESRARLANGLREQRFGAGEDIIRQEAPGDSLFIIDRGRVDVRVGVDGIHRSVAQLGPGQFFGEMSLMTGEHRLATCTAITDTTCYVVEQGAFRCILDARPTLAEEISHRLAERQTELSASRDGLSAEARVRHERDTRSHLLAAIRRAFQL